MDFRVATCAPARVRKFGFMRRGCIQLILLRPRSTEFKELEIVVLRHQLAVLRRRGGAERVVLAYDGGRFRLNPTSGVSLGRTA